MPLYSVCDVDFFKFELKFRTEPTKRYINFNPLVLPVYFKPLATFLPTSFDRELQVNGVVDRAYNKVALV